MEERTIKCQICDAIIEDVCVLPPELIARFYKWIGTIRNRNGTLYESFYCPKHSTKEIKDFDSKSVIIKK